VAASHVPSPAGDGSESDRAAGSVGCSGVVKSTGDGPRPGRLSYTKDETSGPTRSKWNEPGSVRGLQSQSLEASLSNHLFERLSFVNSSLVLLILL
jgi:hypothetical protein